MIPGKPRQLCPIGTEAWCGIEVVASNEHLLFLVTAIKLEAHQRVHRFSPSHSVVLTHTDHTISPHLRARPCPKAPAMYACRRPSLPGYRRPGHPQSSPFPQVDYVRVAAPRAATSAPVSLQPLVLPHCRLQ